VYVVPEGLLFISVIRFLFFSSVRRDLINSSSLASSLAMSTVNLDSGEIEYR